MNNTAIITKRIPYEQYYYLICPNIAARKNKYTVYRIPTSEAKRVKIIGRELDLKTAKYVINNEIKIKCI